jgi:ABC-2 type transport system ATP-binding protein
MGVATPMAPDVAPVVIRGLTKHLGGVVAVDDLDLTVEHGQVLGLAGPNGAGKSVTIKILLGLIRPDSGTVALFGEAAGQGVPALARVGALVDGPGFVPHLSGHENLRLAGLLSGDRGTDGDLKRAIEMAGLGDAIDRKYHTYSHGMRYRLGLAQALLGRPDLLVLDEPTTGLDPVHIREIRHAIGRAAADGATVLFSSHLLSEVEQVCTHTAVMQRGRVIASGRVEDLVRRTDLVSLRVESPDRAAAILVDLNGVTGVRVEEDTVVVEGEALRPTELLVVLDAAGIGVEGLRRGRSLEDAYLALVTGRESGATRVGAVPPPS